MCTAVTGGGAPRRLALTLSGAASLGAFEAGVLTELLYGLDYWCETSTVTAKTGADIWETIRQSAIASGNFPIAFAPAYLTRKEGRFPGHLWKPFPPDFPYIDGGLFNNEPIKFMVDLALDADGGDLGSERKFLLIDANLNKVKRWQRANPPASATAILGDVMRLLGMLRGEASALDWLQAQRRNNEIAWRDRLLDELVPMIKGNSLEKPETFLTQLESVAADIVKTKRALFPDRYPATYLEDSLRRTAQAHPNAVAEVGGATRQRIYTLVVFIINSIAGPRQEGAARHRRDLRAARRDGRAPAWVVRRVLQPVLARARLQTRPCPYPPGATGDPGRPCLPDRSQRADSHPGPEYDPAPIDTKNVSMEHTDVASRKAFRDAVLAKAMPLVESVKLGPWPVEAIANRVIKSKVGKWLDQKLSIQG